MTRPPFTGDRPRRPPGPVLDVTADLLGRRSAGPLAAHQREVAENWRRRHIRLLRASAGRRSGGVWPPWLILDRHAGRGVVCDTGRSHGAVSDRDDALRKELGWTGPEESDYEPTTTPPTFT